ncbi:MAG: hypothetical protein AAFZ11_10985, partial [Pseudomonadota bacterium]
MMAMTNLMSRASKLTKSSVSAACLASALVLGPSAPTMAQSSQVQQYTVRACNQINERVYLALAFPVSSPKWQFDAEGWWYIDPGDCLLINMNEIWARAGVQDSMMPNSGQPIRPNTFFYAETRGLNLENFTLLTAPKEAMEDLYRQFGIVAYEADGTIDHTMGTLLI